MIVLNFDYIELSSAQIKLLKKLRKNTGINPNIPLKDLQIFKNFNFIERSNLSWIDGKPSVWVLSEQGKMYLRYKRKSFIRTYLPITISIVALIKSFFPEIISVAEQLLKLSRQ